MTKTYAACTPATLLSIARRDLAHCCEMLALAGLSSDVADQLHHKLKSVVNGTMDTYGPGSIGAEVKALADAQAATSVAEIETDEKVSQP